VKTVRTIQELRDFIREYRHISPSEGVGLVPTMGFLHEGHVSLMERARKECGLVVLSIFVNPLQFGPSEDFERYPRDEHKDLVIAEQAGVDIVFVPSLEEMYPSPMQATVTMTGDMTKVLCGASRPGHFDGVATVVSKLFHIAQPDKAYFGLKDAQQVAVIEQMVHDLNIPIEIVPCPIIRDPDGLAKSSRNVYLSEEERSQALVLSQSLEMAEQWYREGFTDAAELRRLIAERIESAPLARIDYVDIRWYPSLRPADSLQCINRNEKIIVALAVKFGNTRLIDNRLLTAVGER
jgi:pantoate--beta-alanine ligase